MVPWADDSNVVFAGINFFEEFKASPAGTKDHERLFIGGLCGSCEASDDLAMHRDGVKRVKLRVCIVFIIKNMIWEAVYIGNCFV